MTEVIKPMTNCHVSVYDTYIYIYLRCTNLFVHFVASSILLCAIAEERASTFCCIYIGGRSMTYDVKFMYEMDMYLNNIYLDFKFLYLF